MNIDFRSFRDGPGGEICRRIGVEISTLQSWREYTDAMVRFNSRGELIRNAEKFAECGASTGESVLLAACLTAADFASQADDLIGDRTWRRLDKTSGAFRKAVIACLARIDSVEA